MAEFIMAVPWFIIFGGGGILVACDFRWLAEKVFNLIDRYSIASPGEAAPRTIRIVDAIFVAISVFGVFVIALSHAQGN
ncbi:hypothetical protein [Kitasatospora sp. NPDC087315]|uniref:hypothetical protein n=1 Tax=Kitasatospora sp. NPDC087315 TaxID=3364069 RepID=UPI003805D1DD